MKNIKSDLLPADRLEGLKKHWKTDLLSGFTVFMVALPLCLGISLASGVPPLAGIIAAIVGGIIVSQISGSYVTINGPAAGLIVVVLGAVEAIGEGDIVAGYRGMIAAVVVAGLLLFVLGKLKAGRFADFFPLSAVHGMLAAIGVIIIAKQIHVMLGVKPDSKEILGLIAEIPKSISLANPEIAVIGLVSLGILIVIPLVKIKWLKVLPTPMIVVVVGMIMGHLFDLEDVHTYSFFNHDFELGPKFLVTLPAKFIDGIVFPDFTVVSKSAFWIAVVTITLVQGLETLLSTKAVDSLDPHHRKSDMNKDMAAVGIGSAVSGLLGGLPIIAEIVRSSANVANGAQTRWSNFFHGAFMLVFVVFFPFVIHQIPLSALAAILIYTGYRLASPKQFSHSLHIGFEQLAIFCTTLIVTLATDLIIGVGSGIALKFVIHLFRGAAFKCLFMLRKEIQEFDAEYRVTITHSATFSNYLHLKGLIDKSPKDKMLVIDLSDATLVDHTVMDHLHHFQESFKREGRTLEIVGLHYLKPMGKHPLAARLKVSSLVK